MLKTTFKSLSSASVIAALVVLGGSHVALADGKMTKEDFVKYYQLFDKNDPHYADYLSDDVVFPHMSGKTFHGKAEVLAFYHKMMNTGFQEERIPSTIIIDNEDGMAAVEMTNRMWANPGSTAKTPDGQVMKPGEVYEGHNVMIYGIKDGKITSIRGSAVGAGKVVRVK